MDSMDRNAPISLHNFESPSETSSLVFSNHTKADEIKNAAAFQSPIVEVVLDALCKLKKIEQSQGGDAQQLKKWRFSNCCRSDEMSDTVVRKNNSLIQEIFREFEGRSEADFLEKRDACIGFLRGVSLSVREDAKDILSGVIHAFKDLKEKKIVQEAESPINIDHTLKAASDILLDSSNSESRHSPLEGQSIQDRSNFPGIQNNSNASDSLGESAGYSGAIVSNQLVDFSQNLRHFPIESFEAFLDEVTVDVQSGINQADNINRLPSLFFGNSRGDRSFHTSTLTHHNPFEQRFTRLNYHQNRNSNQSPNHELERTQQFHSYMNPMKSSESNQEQLIDSDSTS